jgi:hypothetical protein
MVAAALLRTRSIAGPNQRGGEADAADPEPVKGRVAPGRMIRRPGQVGSERLHAPASRVGEIDLSRRLRLSGSGSERAEQGNRRTDNAHWYGSPIFRTSFARLSFSRTNALDQLDPKPGGWIEPDAARLNGHNRNASPNSHGCSAFSVRSPSARVRPRLIAATGFPRLTARWTKRNPE